MMLAFGLACMAVYAVNAWSAADAKPRYADAVGVSMMLCVSYGLSNVLVMVYGLPDAINAFPIMDAVFSFMIWRAWKRNHRQWKLAILALLVSQLILHAVFIALWKIGGLKDGELWRYVALVNLTFTGQLVVVGGVGLGHVLARARAWLSGVRRRHAHEGAR